LIVFIAVLGTACTGGEGAGPSPTTSAPTTSPVPTGPVHFQPGHYGYEFGGVVAEMVFDGSHATLDVKNGTGAELATPAVYVVDGMGAHRDGVVTDSGPIPDGESATFQVTFPDSVNPTSIGLVILLFGDSNWGDFAPVAVA
jgi:hypothetical protein